MDNHIAVDVGGLRRGTRSFRVGKPQFRDAYPETVVREHADELTLRAGEVGPVRTFVDTTHIELGRWGLRPVDVDWHVRPFRKESKDKSGKRCAVAAKNCTRRQEPKSWVTVKSPKPELDCNCGKNTLKVRWKHWRRRQNAWKPPMNVEVRVPRSFVRVSQAVCLSLCPPEWRPVCSLCKDFEDDVGGALLGRNVACFGSVGCCGFAHDSQRSGRPKEVWPYGELFFFLTKKEPFALTKVVEFLALFLALCYCRDIEKVCALISLHMIAEEATSFSQWHFSEVVRSVEVWRSKEPFVERRRWRVDRKRVHIFL